jgi:hypothetical protein
VESPLLLASLPSQSPAFGNKITQYMIFLIGNESVSPKKLSRRKINDLQFSNREEFSFFHPPLFPLPMDSCSFLLNRPVAAPHRCLPIVGPDQGAYRQRFSARCGELGLHSRLPRFLRGSRLQPLHSAGLFHGFLSRALPARSGRIFSPLFTSHSPLIFPFASPAPLSPRASWHIIPSRRRPSC